MSMPSRFMHTGYFYSIFLIGMFICLLSACTIVSTTTYIKAPPPGKVTQFFSKPSCLNIGTIELELDNQNIQELEPLRSSFSREPNIKNKFIAECKSQIVQYRKLVCPITYDDLWSAMRQKVIEQNNGLLDTKLGWGDYEQQLISAIGKTQKENEISISRKEPASLSLSVRPWPVDQDPTAFANLKERAQASLIEYAKAYVQIPGKKDGKEVPVASAESLLNALSKTEEPRFPEKRRFELTVSSMINSANIDDRFDYISVYLTVPTLPGAINGRISLERLFLQYFQSLYFSRTNSLRDEYLSADISQALDSIQVRIEIIDPLKTEAASISLGTLSSTATAGPTFSIDVGGTKGSTTVGSISSTRTDTLAKELDKRSFWINDQRSLLRITQRGMQEATISGSFASAITLRIPKTNLYIMDFNYEEDGKTIKEVVLNDIEQPLYISVYGVGSVLGTVRAAIPSRYPYRKELSGLAFTVVEEKPILLRLWNNDRQLLLLSHQDLNPDMKKPVVLGVFRRSPFVKQAAYFKDSKSLSAFKDALRSNKTFKLIKRSVTNSNWYAIVPCTKANSLKDMTVDEAEPGEVMIGVEDVDGHIRPFNSSEIVTVLGGCK